MADPAAQKRLEKCNPKPYEPRWGAVIHSVSLMVDMEHIICCSWDLERFCFGKKPLQDTDDDDEQELRLQTGALNLAITSGLFWAYCKAMDSLGVIMHQLEIWAEGCACHVGKEVIMAMGAGGPRYQGAGASGGQPSHSFTGASCPMRGRRAPELAAGECVSLVQSIGAMGAQAVLEHVQPLSGKEANIVLGDFTQARNSLLCTLQMKLSSWTQLPAVLSAIGHHNVHTARQGMRRAMSLWDSTEHCAHHSLSRLALQQGTGQRHDIENFVQGASLWQCNFCAQLASRLKFIVIVERGVEGQHARAHRATLAAPHSSSMHIAWSLLQNSLRRKFLHDPAFVVILGRKKNVLG